MNTAFLLTGGNIGNRMQYLQKAKEVIMLHCGNLIAESKIYETEAWGKEDQQKFLNQALKIQTHLNAEELLHHILNIEERLGRQRGEKFGPRKIDIDILLFNHEIIDTYGLKVPHPQLQNRRFALKPLVDIGAEEIHPVLNKSILQLYELCPDPLKVSIYNGG